MLALGGIVVLGIFAQWLAWRGNIPAILPLIIMGLLVGPIAELLLGYKLIDPVVDFTVDANGNIVPDNGLFTRSSLFYFVSLSIGIILFEGGLTLKLNELRGIGNAIGKLITIGSLITFLGGTLAAHFIMGLPWDIACLFAALIIVTGPTVIAPILRNVSLSKNVATVLKWEGILIDPIGALAAVLVFEFIAAGIGQHGHEHLFSEQLIDFFNVVAVGGSLGFTAAHFLNLMLRGRNLLPHYLLNVVTLALVIGVFIISDELAHESGLLTVVVMGLVLANLNVPHLKDILDFKESLTILLISILFIVLSANIDQEQLSLLTNNPNSFILLGVVILVLRPIGVFASTIGSALSFNEKLFISWVGPRGIVAAGIASLFGLRLVERNVPGAEMITPLVFLIVLGTVLLNATTARMFARMLNVTLKKASGIVLVGANAAARSLGKYLIEHQREVILIDRSKTMVKEAKEEGLTVLQEDIYDENLKDKFELAGSGYLLAMTGSDEVNEFAASQLKSRLGENGTFRLLSAEESKNPDTITDSVLFSTKASYLNINKIATDYPVLQEKLVANANNINEILNDMEANNCIPLLLKKDNGSLHFIPANFNIEVENKDTIVYMGKNLSEDN